ncbi:MAG TPA: 2-C-methyl-D-erythritol 2,4-cyclodiphosphate synthase, partial [Gammaproteobacteria bacterium]|nr:2-C-methyl-D-erythritol 2,4-cyclodiphosphate synthase [Gammaproteobacteria bacterium]
MRIGIGYDVHRLVHGRQLILGGVSIPSEWGLEGHSDADVLLHAISDALLGALALGDLGQHFPDTDPSYRGISSAELLERVTKMVDDHAYRLHNVDAVV